MTEADESDKKTSRRWADLGPRVISALVLVVVLIAVVFLGGVWFAILVGAVFAGTYREWEIMVTGKRPDVLGMVLIAATMLCALAYPFYGLVGSMAVMIVAALIAMAAPSDARLWRAGGVLYFCLVVMAILAIRGDSYLGVAAAFFMGFAVWFTDSGAFFFGRQLGGGPNFPRIFHRRRLGRALWVDWRLVCSPPRSPGRW